MNVKALREQAGLSQRQLAEKSTISQATLSRIESGERDANQAEEVLLRAILSPPQTKTEAPPPQTPPESQTPVGKPQHLARPGIRRVFICTHNDKQGEMDCKRRVFLEPSVLASFVPNCPEHGPMKRQANRPYFGQSTEPTPEMGWPPAAA